MSDPDAAATPADQSRPSRRSLTGIPWRRMPATVAIILTCTAVELVALASATTVSWSSLGDALGGGVTPLHLWGALIPRPIRFTDIGVTVGGVASGEWWRLVTNVFLHFGPIHLVLNMYALFTLGLQLETAMRTWRFVVLFSAAGLTGSVAVYCFSGDTISAGASGAIFGLFGAFVPLLRRNPRGLRSLLPIIALNLAITFFLPGISIAAHLGGLACGLALGAVLSFRPRSTPAFVGSAIGIAVVLIAACAVRTLQLGG